MGMTLRRRGDAGVAEREMRKLIIETSGKTSQALSLDGSAC